MFSSFNRTIVCSRFQNAAKSERRCEAACSSIKLLTHSPAHVAHYDDRAEVRSVREHQFQFDELALQLF